LLKQNRVSWKAMALAILLVIAVLSMTVISSHLSSPKFYPKTIQTLDKQKAQAMGLTVVVTAASTALSTLPDDMCSPIADELSDLADPLFLIICILYLEKYLLTIFGWISFSFLVPAACVLIGIYICSFQEKFYDWARKILVLAVTLFMIIPISATITNKIEETYAESITLVLEKANQLTNTSENAQEEQINAFVKFFTDLKDNALHLVEAAKNMLSIVTDGVAVLLITSCIIPVLTALVFLGFIKTIINVNIPVKTWAIMVKSIRKKRKDFFENTFDMDD